jgi:hypothetical protein
MDEDGRLPFDSPHEHTEIVPFGGIRPVSSGHFLYSRDLSIVETGISGNGSIRIPHRPCPYSRSRYVLLQRRMLTVCLYILSTKDYCSVGCPITTPRRRRLTRATNVASSRNSATRTERRLGDRDIVVGFLFLRSPG